jgi:predicted nucleic acid-binding protein
VGGLLDTNILLYGANADAPEHAAAHRFLEAVGRTAEPWYVTEGIVYEFLRVSTHPKVFPTPIPWTDALAFLRPLLEAANVHLLQATDRHWGLLDEILRSLTHPSGNLFFDVRTN